MDTAEDCSEDLSSMFQMFDKHGDGTVTAGQLHHHPLSPTFLSCFCHFLDAYDDWLSWTFYLSFDLIHSVADLVRHLLHEAQAPTRLSTAEVDEFMSYAGLKSRGRGTRKAAGKSKGKRERVDYDDLIGKLLFV